MAAAPTTPSPDLILVRPSPAELPVGAALDVVRLPLVLAMKKRQGVSDADEERAGDLEDEQLTSLPILPQELYELTYRYTDRYGVQHRVFITGDNRLGLPYGQDGDVLVALFKLIDEDRQRVLAGERAQVRDGEFVGVTVRQIARAMGHENVHGKLIRRIRAALRRMAHVRILATSSEFRDERDVAAAVLAGRDGASPVVPTRGRRAPVPNASGAAPRAREEEVTWLLEYRWRTEYLRQAEGESWIVHLKLNPRWFDQAVSGWVAWIDTQRYRALGGPLAKRLYQLLAVEAAFGTPAPWTFSLEQLRRACAISEKRQANEVVKSLVPAAAELCDLEILSGAEHRKVKRGEHEMTFTPGPALLLASLMRGASAADLHETRVQLAFLRAFGVDPTAARAMVERDPAAVHDALAYALFLKETAPNEVARSWSRMIAERVEQQRSNAGVVGFEEWMRKRRAKASLLRQPAAPATAEVQRLPDIALPDGVWGRVLGVLRAEEPEGLFRAYLAETTLVRIDEQEDGTVVVVVSAPSEYHAEKIRRGWAPRLESLLRAELGAVARLRVEGA